MKNNLLFYIVLTCTVLLASCGQQSKKVTHKYQDQPRVVYCKQIDTVLVKEAFYSFKEDVASYYNNQGYEKGSLPYYHNGFTKYVNSLIGNNASYNLVASEHSKKLARELKKHPEIWTIRDGETIPNLESSFLKCITKDIDDFPLKALITKVYQKGSISRENMLASYYKNVGKVHQDNSFSLFLALDTFYAHLGEETEKE
ncbi:hypothetical protein [Patiriisocius hiemis]|uniref:Lipoprotein n=1 Tax=Patiriisocius hiemis TaxID=3075604 RepID=A0ABU2Y9Y5_9FLAO|nr:hypothetical protein [Constantimarinum sp. W242]MDT0554459.1 hypothetical protein [Constantimarinum sp. W242]